MTKPTRDPAKEAERKKIRKLRRKIKQAMHKIKRDTDDGENKSEHGKKIHP